MNPVRTTRIRLGFVAILALSLFATLLARLYYLQVLAGPDLTVQAQRNAARLVEEPPVRGRILDRNGKVLVDNRASNVVAVDRTIVRGERRVKVLDQLSKLLGAPVETLERRLDDPRVSPYVPVPVASDVPEATLVRILERRDEFRGIVAEQRALRTYPNGALGAHILGYVGEVNDADISQFGAAYVPGDQIGKAGVERVYERQLRGTKGRRLINVTASGEPVGILENTAAKPGSDVVLSLDLDLQRVAEQALAQGLEAARGRSFGNTNRPLVADAGAAVVLDLTEGTVLAMASYPSFDPGALADGVSKDEATRLFDKAAGAPFTNRAVSGQYAPGSTWKLVTAAAALERGLITPNTTVDDNGFFIIPECVGKCRFQNAGATRFGRVDLPRALAVSSDVYFYKIGADLWVRRKQFGESAIQDTAKSLGFGAQTGIALPSESAGRVPTPETRRRLYEERPDVYVTGDWFTGDNVNLAIGQGELTVTPLQLASVYGSFATGRGFSWNVALRVTGPKGRTLQQLSPRTQPAPQIAAQTRAAVLNGLRGATTIDRGTATPAFAGFPMDRFPVGGKTGTAQAMPKQDTALFVALAPIDAPRYAVAVVMEQAGFGSTSAAPVARRILAQLSGVEPPTPVGLAPGGQG